MMGSVGFGEIMIIAIIALFVFGPDRLPELSKKAGEFIAQARKAVGEFTASMDRESGEGMAPFREIGAELKGVKDDLTKAAGSVFDLSTVGESKPTQTPNTPDDEKAKGNKAEASSSSSSAVDEPVASVSAESDAERQARRQARKQERKQRAKQQEKQDRKNQEKKRALELESTQDTAQADEWNIELSAVDGQRNPKDSASSERAPDSAEEASE